MLGLTLFISVLFTGILGQPAADKITNLPGLNFATNYDQYSGYLRLNNGHNLHYWLTESQSDPVNDPLVLWLNGGPGCSSLDGLFYEQGPFHVYDDGTLYPNPYAWNLNASVIFLEAPICVGFSYTNGSCSASDNSTADDNYLALLQFFIKFPNFVKNDFYITGESYGGVYVPTLTRRVLEGNANKEGTAINLKGFAVGNGVTSDQYLSDSIKWFYEYHGIFDDTEWASIQKACCKEPYTRQNCKFNSGVACENAVANAERNKLNDINRYDLYGVCYGTNLELKDKLDKQGLLYPFEKLKRHYQFVYNISLEGTPPCLDSKGATTYLNRQDVQKAIHVETNLPRWSICSNDLRYQDQYFDLAPVYKDIFSMDPNIYATVYNGDTDMACNFLGDEWFVEDLGYPAKNTWRQWYFEDNGKQVGGWTKDYQKIHFVTVRGSGHMVPQYRPIPALKMFQYFIANKDLD